MMSVDRRAMAASRLWWAVPVALTIVTTGVVVMVVLPALAGGVAVPPQLIVHRAPSSVVPAQSPSAASQPVQPNQPTQLIHSTTVVAPAQPVVRESDERPGDQTESGSGKPNDS